MSNNTALAITDDDINALKQQIDEKKKLAEYEKLKSDLHDISCNAANKLTEFDGGLKQIDTEKVLTTKRCSKSLSELILERFQKMLSLRPIVGGVIGIALTLIGIVLIFNNLHNPKIDPYKIYFVYFLESAIAVQVLKSASRSLLLPILATVIGAIVSGSITEKQLFLQHHQMFYQVLMMLGLTGIAISVFTID